MRYRNLIFVALVAGLLASCAQSRPKQDVAKDPSIHCLQDTGSRIKRAPGECTDSPGRVVTREEMERTGATNTADAIRRVVPQAR